MNHEFNLTIHQDKFDFYQMLWNKFKPYADTNFLTELHNIEKHQQRIWEMYFCSVLLERDVNLVHRSDLDIHGPKNEGPDFITKNKIYIECISPTKGYEGNCNSLNTPYRSTINNPEFVQIAGNRHHDEKLAQLGISCDIKYDFDVERKILLRITQSINEKYKKYKKWQSKKWFCDNYAYIIAINTFDLEYIQNPYMPYVIKSLFGIDNQMIDFNNKYSFWTYKKSIKKNNSDIDITYFCNDSYNEISGIIFSNESSHNYSNKIGGDCFIIKNPYAKSKIPNDFSSKFNEFTVEEDDNCRKFELIMR